MLFRSHLVAPRERLISLNDAGTASKASFVAVIITGKLIIARVKEPERIEVPNLKNITKKARFLLKYLIEYKKE